MKEHTHPSVLEGIAAGAAWADPTMDPTTIDWAARRSAAAVWFDVVDGRPVNPGAPTGIRYGRNQLGHWGEQRCADAIVIATDRRHQLLMVERDDGHGWALPGGHVEPSEGPTAAALRELAEETGLVVDLSAVASRLPARHVPDPRESDEAWMVTTPTVIAIAAPADVQGSDDAKRAAWIPAGSYDELVRHLASTYGGRVFAAHRGMLAEVLGTEGES